jgi:hypothetical protein
MRTLVPPITPSCPRRSAACCRTRTCRAGPRDCQGPACSCRRGQPDRRSSHGTGRRSRPASRRAGWAARPAAAWPLASNPGVLVARVFRGQFVGFAQRLRIGHLRVGLLQGFELFRRALQDPHGLAAPFHRLHLARLERADIDLYRSAGGLGALRRCKARNERHGGCNAAHSACPAGDTHPGSAARVDGILAHEFPRRTRNAEQPRILADAFVGSDRA